MNASPFDPEVSLVLNIPQEQKQKQRVRGGTTSPASSRVEQKQLAFCGTVSSASIDGAKPVGGRRRNIVGSFCCGRWFGEGQQKVLDAAARGSNLKHRQRFLLWLAVRDSRRFSTQAL
uniref:Uncharacterized protein n=1 Tax=Oryza barthii TaxID=65489 RepID=A0A0D3G5I6_9ORYZ